MVEHGTTAQLFHEPRHPYTRALARRRPATSLGGGHAAISKTQSPDISLPLVVHPGCGEPERGRHERHPRYRSARFKTFRAGRPHRCARSTTCPSTIERGGCLAIVGESGSGKSTHRQHVLGIYPPTAGRARLRGSALPARRDPAHRRAIQLVQQNPLSSLNPKRSVGASLRLPLDVHGIGERIRPRRAHRAAARRGRPAARLRTRSPRVAIRRPAPARRDRARAGLPVRAGRARRADLGARRAGAGACAEAARRAARASAA